MQQSLSLDAKHFVQKRQVVDIAVTLLTQLKLCVLSSKYKTVNP